MFTSILDTKPHIPSARQEFVPRNTLLTGPVVDDAALHGLLKKVRDLGMELFSVNRVAPDQSDAEDKKIDNKDGETK